MRWTQTLIPTMKETPADAEAVSHKLMVRAGMMRQLAQGFFSYLPLGWRSLNKIITIIREEMDAAGAAELLMPTCHPVELWQETGRETDYGPVLFHLKDRKDRTMVLGPTHEEIITDIARAHLSSYKQLPLNLYQIQTKFRDEERPKSGVLRTREFIMKDAYSFDVDAAGLHKAYDIMYKAYCRIFARCGVECQPVEADSGPIGGGASHEFMVVSDGGEDLLVKCTECAYAANMERAAAQPIEKVEPETLAEVAEVSTPGQRTIEQVCEFLGCKPRDMIKTLIVLADDTPVVVLVRGDHELHELKLAKILDAKTVEMADDATVGRITNAPTGFAGPVGLKDVRILTDQAVTAMSNAVTGANKDDTHLTGVNPGRDFATDEIVDVRTVTPEDRCPRCGSKISIRTALEVGHVFKLGSKYSQAMGATVLDADNKDVPLVMGCYGIGIARILAGAIELYNDENGIIFPIAIAPFQALIVTVNQDDEAVVAAGEQIYEQLAAAGMDALLDDRDLRAGVKFKDADLIGIPVRVTIGKRALADGNIEIKLRRESRDATRIVPLEKAVETVQQLVDELMAECRPI